MSAVPVEGLHVMLKGVPTGMASGKVALVKEEGFWAAASVARTDRGMIE